MSKPTAPATGKRTPGPRRQCAQEGCHTFVKTDGDGFCSKHKPQPTPPTPPATLAPIKECLLCDQPFTGAGKACAACLSELAGETAVSAVSTPRIPAPTGAPDGETVHQESAPQKSSPNRADIAKLSGTFVGYIDQFKKTAQREDGWPIVRVRTPEIYVSNGDGHWLACEPELLSKLVKRAVHKGTPDQGLMWLPVDMKWTIENGRIVKAGRVKDANGKFLPWPVDTAGVETSGEGRPMIPARPRKDDTPKEKRAAVRKAASAERASSPASKSSAMTLRGPVMTTASGALSGQCRCGRRMNTAGFSPIPGMCAICHSEMMAQHAG